MILDLSQCCPHIETSQLIYCANQLIGFYMRATLALNGLSYLLLFIETVKVSLLLTLKSYLAPAHILFFSPLVPGVR